jgi:predicted small metal-binding protein
VLHQVARHAAEAHGLTEIPDSVVTAVRAAIVDVPA